MPPRHKPPHRNRGTAAPSQARQAGPVCRVCRRNRPLSAYVAAKDVLEGLAEGGAAEPQGDGTAEAWRAAAGRYRFVAARALAHLLGLCSAACLARSEDVADELAEVWAQGVRHG